VEELVRPALAQGRLVVTDRYVDSTRAYQGYGRGLSHETIDTLWRIATGSLRPDLCVLLDLPVELGLLRVGKRGAEDRLESEVREFHDRVRDGYHSLVKAEPDRWLVLDGAAEPKETHARLVAEIRKRGLEPHSPGIEDHVLR
jgi:dTMP kinase